MLNADKIEIPVNALNPEQCKVLFALLSEMREDSPDAYEGLPPELVTEFQASDTAVELAIFKVQEVLRGINGQEAEFPSWWMGTY